MNLNLEGKTALITGSAAGIGLNIALKLHEYGCQIGINSRNQESLKNAKTFFKDSVFGIVADMRSEDSAKAAINQFVNEYGTLDILVCNVGSGKSASPFKENVDDWQKSFSENLLSAINPISASIDHLSRSEGVITCISSICGEKMIENAPLTYSSLKASLNRYVINSSFYLAKKKIRINAVSPGNVYFPGSIWEEKCLKNREQVNQMLAQKVPLNKFVKPSEIADAVAFLSSPLSSSTTGQILSIDAGQSAF